MRKRKLKPTPFIDPDDRFGPQLTDDERRMLMAALLSRRWQVTDLARLFGVAEHTALCMRHGWYNKYTGLREEVEQYGTARFIELHLPTDIAERIDIGIRQGSRLPRVL
jgi:hypothetical protein